MTVAVANIFEIEHTRTASQMLELAAEFTHLFSCSENIAQKKAQHLNENLYKNNNHFLL